MAGDQGYPIIVQPRSLYSAALVLTKSDKLARSRAAEARRAISKETSVPEDRLALVSARTRAGLDTLHSWIGSWTGIEIP